MQAAAKRTAAHYGAICQRQRWRSGGGGDRRKHEGWELAPNDFGYSFYLRRLPLLILLIRRGLGRLSHEIQQGIAPFPNPCPKTVAKSGFRVRTPYWELWRLQCWQMTLRRWLRRYECSSYLMHIPHSREAVTRCFCQRCGFPVNRASR